MIQGVGPIEDDSQYLDRFSGILEHSKYLEKKNNLNFYLYPRFPYIASEKYKTILFVGETGSGKTSSINFFLNYCLGVKFEDNIRFKLIDEQKQGGSQAVSQTQNVNIYYVKPINGHDGLRIVDTPGFNDTRGMSQDQKILDQIKNCFKKDIVDISAICFLIKATETRLTSAQQYVFSQIVQIFGKNILNNLIFLFPFFDNDEEEDPEALQIVKFKGDKQTQNQKCCLAEFYDQMVEPKYIKYNNTNLYSLNNKKGNKKESNEEDSNEEESNEEKWKYFMEQFNKLKEKIKRIQPASLQLTLDVMVEREKLRHTIKQMKPLIRSSLSAIITMKESYKAINQLEPQIKAVSNYTYTQTIWTPTTNEYISGYRQRVVHTTQKKQVQKKPTQSFYSTSSRTNSMASQKKKVTTIYNEPIYAQSTSTYPTEQIVINYELKQQYDQLEAEKNQKQVILENIQNDFLLWQGQFNKLKNEFHNCSRKLQQIALSPILINQQEKEYIEKMLQVTQNYFQRLPFHEMMENIKITEEILKENGDSQKTQDFYNQLLQAKKEGTIQRLLS